MGGIPQDLDGTHRQVRCIGPGVSPFRLPVILPLITTIASVLVVVKLAAGERPPAASACEPGQVAGLRARLGDGRASGRLVLTVHELVWWPDDPAFGSWRASLDTVEVLARPPHVPGRLVLVVQGRTVELAVDDRSWPACRSDCTGAWFADLVETAAARETSCRGLQRQIRVVGLLRLSAAAELVEGDGGGDPDVERVGGPRHRDADPTVGRLQRCVRQPGPLGAE